MNLLWFLLFLPIFARVCSLGLAKALMPLRKELGILMGTLAWVHGAAYTGSYPSMVGESYFWLDDTTILTYLAFGFFALVLTIPLTLTSSNWAMRKLGKRWKVLHRAVYLIIILAVIHVVLLKWAKHLEIGPVILLITYFGFKVLEWRGYSFAKKESKAYPK
jgi:sulfoxide reductase heme-binding subunit YedZ